MRKIIYYAGQIILAILVVYFIVVKHDNLTSFAFFVIFSFRHIDFKLDGIINKLK